MRKRKWIVEHIGGPVLNNEGVEQVVSFIERDVAERLEAAGEGSNLCKGVHPRTSGEGNSDRKSDFQVHAIRTGERN